MEAVATKDPIAALIDACDDAALAGERGGPAAWRETTAAKDAAEQAVRASLARIRAVVETAERILRPSPTDDDWIENEYVGEEPERAGPTLSEAPAALTDDDRRLLGMES